LESIGSFSDPDLGKLLMGAAAFLTSLPAIALRAALGERAIDWLISVGILSSRNEDDVGFRRLTDR
jgi:hypothetical protein